MDKKSYLNKGDLLLVSSKFDPLARLIQLGLRCKWNHVAWIYSETHVLEVKRFGVFMRPIRGYYNSKLFDVKIVRPKNLTPIEIELVECLLLEQKTRLPYSKLLITLMLVACKFKKQLPRPTCSGLIAQGLAQVGFHFNDKPTHLITPRDIAKSKNVDVFYE